MGGFLFGYVTVGKDQLTEAEYEVFCSYYCGVCRSIGKCASQTARLGLSFDITFLALVLSSAVSVCPETNEGRCIAHPKKKRRYVYNDEPVDYAAAMGVLLDCLKFEDDRRDEHSIKALFMLLLFKRGCGRVKKRYKKQYGLIKEGLDRLSRLEAEKCGVLDEAADAFAKILEALFTPDFIEEEGQRRSLAWFGYNLGRWIYIIDAFNDLEEDKESGSYNPLLASGRTDKKECAGEIEFSMTVTLANIASAYELIDFKRNRDIIGKMIYISLKEKQRYILEGTNKKGRKKGSTDESV